MVTWINIKTNLDKQCLIKKIIRMSMLSLSCSTNLIISTSLHQKKFSSYLIFLFVYAFQIYINKNYIFLQE
jgi:hypothetical protein